MFGECEDCGAREWVEVPLKCVPGLLAELIQRVYEDSLPSAFQCACCGRFGFAGMVLCDAQ